MAGNCDNCHAEVNGRFCAQCGKPTSSDIEPWSADSGSPPEASEAPCAPEGPPEAPGAPPGPPDAPGLEDIARPATKGWKEQLQEKKRAKGGANDAQSTESKPKEPVVAAKPNFADEAKAKAEARAKRMAEKEAATAAAAAQPSTSGSPVNDKKPEFTTNLRSTPKVGSPVEKAREEAPKIQVNLRPVTQKVPLNVSPKPKTNASPVSPASPLPPSTSLSSTTSLSQTQSSSSSSMPSQTQSFSSSSQPSTSASGPRGEVADLSLSSAHISALRNIALRGVVLIVLALFGMGTLAPRYLNMSLHRACNIAGVLHILLLSFLFFNSYKPNVSNLSKQQRQVGFILFWFYAAITFNFTWQLPLWNVPFIRDVPLGEKNLWWGIVWWSYTVSDKVYFDKTPMMISIEFFWFLGNFFGIAGLWRFYKGRHSEALVLFIVCGALQCYNATFYIFITWYADNFAPMGPEVLDKVVFWGFNCLWPSLGTLAAWLSYRLLVPRLQDKKQQ